MLIRPGNLTADAVEIAPLFRKRYTDTNSLIVINTSLDVIESNFAPSNTKRMAAIYKSITDTPTTIISIKISRVVMKVFNSLY